MRAVNPHGLADAIADKKKESEKLAADIEAFLAAGGKVQVLAGFQESRIFNTKGKIDWHDHAATDYQKKKNRKGTRNA